MPKLFCIVGMNGSDPNLDRSVTPYVGHVHIGDINQQWGAYMVSGTGPQLVAINALPQVVGIVAVTESGSVKWAELDNVISETIRTKINTWLTNKGYPTIPSGWTYRQVVQAIFKRLNASFDLGLNLHDVTE